jgi:putative transposase
MPAKFTVKQYVKGGIYHIYNRGIEKRTIFTDEKDYEVFLSYLEDALHPKIPAKSKGSTHKIKKFTKEIELLSFCLMPDHFHLLVKQLNDRGIDTFMQSILVRYTMYFNRKHKRSGTLFQGKYKAALVLNDPHVLHVSRYIHLNPLEFVENPARAYSSYANYLGYKETPWVKTTHILSYFETEKKDKLPVLKFIDSYREFAMGDLKESIDVLGSLTLE